MTCAWDAYLMILPTWLRKEADKHGKDTLQELRLRLGMPPELRMKRESMFLEREIKREDLDFIVQTASRYSPWAASTAANGYITAQGGHRVGVCGEATVRGGEMTGYRNITSVCVRCARQIPGIAENAGGIQGSVLIAGKPGSGKTTLLRELIRLRSNQGRGSVAVVDERWELFPYSNGKSCFSPGRCTDVLGGCSKAQGIQCVLRAMGPSCIAVDEITAKEDCEALIQAAWNGVDLLATVHASGVRDLKMRPVYRELVESGLFETVLVMQPDQTWRAERMEVCI